MEKCGSLVPGFLRIAYENIHNDIMANFVYRNTLLVILNPETYDPPFTTAFEYCFDLSFGFNHRYIVFFVYLVLFACLDLLYSLVRLIAAGVVFGIVVSMAINTARYLMVLISFRFEILRTVAGLMDVSEVS